MNSAGMQQPQQRGGSGRRARKEMAVTELEGQSGSPLSEQDSGILDVEDEEEDEEDEVSSDL